MVQNEGLELGPQGLQRKRFELRVLGRAAVLELRGQARDHLVGEASKPLLYAYRLGSLLHDYRLAQRRLLPQGPVHCHDVHDVFRWSPR